MPKDNTWNTPEAANKDPHRFIKANAAAKAIVAKTSNEAYANMRQYYPDVWRQNIAIAEALANSLNLTVFQAARVEEAIMKQTEAVLQEFVAKLPKVQ